MMVMVRTAIALVALAALSGCRLNLEHVKDGDAPAPEKVARLEAGKSKLDDALATLGAPDGLEWSEDEDVLFYDSSTARSSRWTMDNPMTYTNLSIMSAVGEAVTYVTFVASKSGALLPLTGSGGRPGVVPLPAFAAVGVAKPLKLNGDASGVERLRLFFDRSSEVLVRIEVSHGAPEGGVTGIARGTFLH
jgi:hypothetical protein